MVKKSSTALSALAVAMVAAGFVLLYLYRNLGGGVPTAAPGATNQPAAGEPGPVLRAVLAGDVEALRQALERGARTDEVARSGPYAGFGPLHIAAALGQESLLVLLLEAGAAADASGNEGRTPLMLGAARGHGSVVARLTEAGASVDARDVHGRTALMAAAQGAHVEAVHALLSAGASLNTADHAGTTALALAAGVPQGQSVVQALLEAGADPDAADHTGFTPLMYAARSGPPGSVVLLLNAGASPGTRAQDGRTALDLARARADEAGQAIADLLAQAGR